jgi:hypothetical protein
VPWNREQARQSKRETASLAACLRLSAQREWKGYGTMDQEPASSQPTAAAPMPFSKVVLGLLPLIVLGLGTTLREVPTTSGLARAIIPISFMGPYPVVLIGLLWGWLKGFPRWVFPYLAYGIFFALYLSRASTPGFAIFDIPMWERELWGWRAFVPLGIIVAVALLLSRPPWGPILKMVRDIWDDWTLFAYGVYGLLPLIIPIMQDEIGRSYRFPTTAIAVIIMLIGAALYLGMPRSRPRTVVMLAGIFLCIMTASVGSSLYWGTHQVNMPTNERHLIDGPIPWGSIAMSSIYGSVFCTLVPLSIPGLVGIAQWFVKRRRSRPSGADA